MIVLGIETSCDETAIALVKKEADKISVLANIVSSQIELHAAWGGVVPNLAAREHLKNILPVLKSALKKAGKKMDDIDLIAVTQGPGLIPALLIGTNFAKTLSYVWQKPLLGIHHIEGHIFANFIKDKIGASTKSQETISKQDTKEEIKFPALALVVSGGHTQLVLMTDYFKYEIIGETQDDAVGEAFDKVARLLGLGYPGGPIISNLADVYSKSEKNRTIKFPRPMLGSGDFNFSFSGLKTAVLYTVKKFIETNNLNEKEKLPDEFIQETAYEFQEAATDVLIHKTIKAGLKYGAKTIFLAGGVSANKNLRDKLGLAVKEKIPTANYILQPINYSTDNAAMIAVTGIYRWEKMSAKEKEDSLWTWKTLQTNAQIILK